ncbi:MAG: hypothetical protein RJQ00_04150 [Vicingaceae bacterium]
MAREKEILLTQLKDLIHVMDSTEIEIAKKHIVAYDSVTKNESQKMFTLFTKFLSISDIDYERLKEKVSPSITDFSFNRLLRRTLYRIQESLISDVNLRRKNLYDDLFRKRYEIRKGIMQASIIKGKGLPHMSKRLFDNIIKNCKKYELYDEIIEALNYKQSIVMFSKGGKSYHDLNNEMNFYNNCRRLLNKTKRIHRSYMTELFTKGGKDQKISYLEKNIAISYKYYEETSSQNIRSYCLLLKMELDYLKDDFDNEEKTGVELLNLMAENKAVYSKGRIIFICNSLGNSMISNLKFKESYSYIKKSLENFDKRNLNYINALQLQITSLFYSGKHAEAEALVKELTSIKLLEKYTFYQAFSTYIIALNKFALAQFKDAYVLLSNLKEIEKDKEGWNVWIRIMRILCSIEMLRLNLIDYDVENFRKYIQRIDKLYEVRKRDKLVLKVLRDLDRFNYDFKIVAEKSASTLNQLRSTDDYLKWDPKSPEMILFHDWFDAKLEKREYSPNFDLYRERLNKKLIVRQVN